MRKAINWLNENQVDFVFHDLKKEVLDKKLVANWLTQIDKNILINKRGTTWRKLDEADKLISEQDELIQLIIDNTSLLKRPVVDSNNDYSVGFNADDWQLKYL